MSTLPLTHTTSDRFLKLLPAVQAHARNKFRYLPDVDREEAIAEATAAAFLNFRIAERHDKADTVTPGTLSRFAVLHVKSGRHVGGSQDRRKDVLSRSAQRRNRFRVYSLPDARVHGYDCMKDPTLPVWKAVLMANRRLGRLQGQYWRAAGAFDVKIAPLARPKGKARLSITWTRNGRWSDWAALSEGCYLLRTNLPDTDPAVLWKRYIRLTEAEWAFRITKDELEKVLLHRLGLRLPQRLRRIAEVARM